MTAQRGAEQSHRSRIDSWRSPADRRHRSDRDVGLTTPVVSTEARSEVGCAELADRIGWLWCCCWVRGLGSTTGSGGAAPWDGGQAAVGRLGLRLPAVAARNGLSAATLRRNLLTDRSLFVDRSGQLLYVEPTAPATAAADRVRCGPRGGRRRGDVQPAQQTGLIAVVYLDFDGHMVSGTGWNSKTGGPCYADAYDSEGVPGTFSPAELVAISGVWARVAEDYAPFDVDVTTADPGQSAITRSSRPTRATAHGCWSPARRRCAAMEGRCTRRCAAAAAGHRVRRCL